MKPLIRAFGATFGILRAEYRQIVNRYFADIERFPGDAREICQQIVDRLWYGDFYRTSLGHYNFFWMRFRDGCRITCSPQPCNPSTPHTTLGYAPLSSRWPRKTMYR